MATVQTPPTFIDADGTRFFRDTSGAVRGDDTRRYVGDYRGRVVTIAWDDRGWGDYVATDLHGKEGRGERPADALADLVRAWGTRPAMHGPTTAPRALDHDECDRRGLDASGRFAQYVTDGQYVWDAFALDAYGPMYVAPLDAHAHDCPACGWWVATR